jgi:hypothetical protein
MAAPKRLGPNTMVPKLSKNPCVPMANIGVSLCPAGERDLKKADIPEMLIGAVRLLVLKTERESKKIWFRERK